MTDIAEAAWRERPCAPPPGTDLCALEEIPDGQARQFSFGEGPDTFRLVALRSGDRVWGYVNKCPHFGVPLNVDPEKFVLFEHAYVFCAVHCAMFRFEDGYCEDGPCTGDSLMPVPLALDARRVRIA